MENLVVQNLTKIYSLKKKQARRAHSESVEGKTGSKKSDTRRDMDGIRALNNVSFSLEPGTILGIIGPNGAGKTTLLKVISRVTPPTAGRIVGRGRVVSLLEMGLGFQRDLSALENIYLTGALYGFSAREIDRKIPAIVDFADLGKFMDLTVSRFSSGMYLRLAFSVAINMAPDILLADEVLAVGDEKFQRRCIERTKEEAGRGKTVLFVSHDMEAIKRLCDQVICLDRGKIIAQGEPYEVVSFYQSFLYQTEAYGDSDQADGSTKAVRILSVGLRSSDGVGSAAARISDPIDVAITFQSDCPPARVRPSLDLYTGNVLILSSVPREGMQISKPGTYTAHVSIPPFLLAETIYMGSVCIHVDCGGRQHTAKKYNAIRFRVYDDAAMREGMNDSRRKPMRGVIAPRLEWELFQHPVDVVRRIGNSRTT